MKKTEINEKKELIDFIYPDNDAENKSRYSRVAELLDKGDYLSARNGLLMMNGYRDDYWYYYNAIANMGLGYGITALDLARKAKSIYYRTEYDDLINKIQDEFIVNPDIEDKTGPPAVKPKFHFFKNLISIIGEVLSSIIHGLGQVLKAIFHIIGFFCKN